MNSEIIIDFINCTGEFPRLLNDDNNDFLGASQDEASNMLFLADNGRLMVTLLFICSQISL
jgi:hypothetical protein